MKILLSAFILFSLSGCVTKEYVFIAPSCPSIELLEKVQPINGTVNDGCVCGDQLDDLLNSTGELRQSETYYFEQVGKYNREFTKSETLDIE